MCSNKKKAVTLKRKDKTFIEIILNEMFEIYPKKTKHFSTIK
jgi:hypothetical protein